MDQKDVYQFRRLGLGRMYPDTLFVIPAGRPAMRSHSVAHRFKATSDFHYLTGLEEAGAILLLQGERHRLLLDLADVSPFEEQGETSEEHAGRLRSLSLGNADDFEREVREWGQSYRRIARIAIRDLRLEDCFTGLAAYGRGQRNSREPLSICDARSLTGVLRAVKDAGEIENLRQAARLSSLVHREILSGKLVGQTELAVSNRIEAGFLMQGMQWTAYETIVGSGPRSTLLHAHGTSKRIRDGELVLIDAGGESNGYCADITRTAPASGRFSKEQREIYAVVLQAQKEVIRAIAPGRTLAELHSLALQSMREGVSRLQGRELSLTELKSLMPHSTSHWIGLDVHDPCPYVTEAGDPVKLQAGMTFTVEPALYFKDKNIGVRIEDDVLVTATGCEVLSSVPKEIEEVEILRGGSGSVLHASRS